MKQERPGLRFPAPFLLIGLGCGPGISDKGLELDKSLWAELSMGQLKEGKEAERSQSLCRTADLNTGMGACCFNSTWKGSHSQGQTGLWRGYSFPGFGSCTFPSPPASCPCYSYHCCGNRPRERALPESGCTELGQKGPVALSNMLIGQMRFGL